MVDISFIKMHGCGNDFVIIDNRIIKYNFKLKEIKHISDRHYGVGCDQLIILEASSISDIMMKIYNQDGTSSDMCGNAARCVAKILIEEKKKDEIFIQTTSKILNAKKIDNHITINMGEASFDWRNIPLSHEFNDILSLPIELKNLKNPAAVSIGNPHMIFFVEDISKIDLNIIGKKLEYHKYFPERVNITIAQIISRNYIKIKVWERGAGETLACGSAACASFAVASVKNMIEEKSIVSLPGGELIIETKDKQIFMTGSAEVSFYGRINL